MASPYGTLSRYRSADQRILPNITQPASGTSAISGITTQDEGVTTGTASGVTTLNFVGAGVSAVGVGSTTTVTISGAGTPTGGRGLVNWTVADPQPAYFTPAVSAGAINGGTVNVSAQWMTIGNCSFVTLQVGFALVASIPCTMSVTYDLPTILGLMGAPPLPIAAACVALPGGSPTYNDRLGYWITNIATSSIGNASWAPLGTNFRISVGAGASLSYDGSCTFSYFVQV